MKETEKRKKERYQKKKEELSKPITITKQTIKGDYEKTRDNTILETHVVRSISKSYEFPQGPDYQNMFCPYV